MTARDAVPPSSSSDRTALAVTGSSRLRRPSVTHRNTARLALTVTTAARAARPRRVIWAMLISQRSAGRPGQCRPREREREEPAGHHCSWHQWPTPRRAPHQHLSQRVIGATLYVFPNGEAARGALFGRTSADSCNAGAPITTKRHDCQRARGVCFRNSRRGRCRRCPSLALRRAAPRRLPPIDAAELAGARQVDLHVAVDLLIRGCDPATAIRILL